MAGKRKAKADHGLSMSMFATKEDYDAAVAAKEAEKAQEGIQEAAGAVISEGASVESSEDGKDAVEALPEVKSEKLKEAIQAFKEPTEQKKVVHYSELIYIKLRRNQGWYVRGLTKGSICGKMALHPAMGVAYR